MHLGLLALQAGSDSRAPCGGAADQRDPHPDDLCHGHPPVTAAQSIGFEHKYDMESVVLNVPSMQNVSTSCFATTTTS